MLMEPCGHLATCGACHNAWANVHGQTNCVLCRTPGRGLHLLTGTTTSDQWPGDASYGTRDSGVNLRVDGDLSVPAIEETLRTPVEIKLSKPTWRRQMREISRRAKRDPPNRETHRYLRANETARSYKPAGAL